MIELKNTSQLIDPVMFRSLPCDAVVGDDGKTVVVKRDIFLLAELLPPHTPIRVECDGRRFLCKTHAEIEEQKQRWERERKEEERQRQLADEKQDRENAEFNRSLNIPMRWHPAHKMVLSGLSERSNGDGAYRNTVVHIYLVEPYRHGRLQRQSGDFLCKVDPWRGGFHDISHLDDSYRVTCKQCLKIAERFANAESGERGEA